MARTKKEDEPMASIEPKNRGAYLRTLFLGRESDIDELIISYCRTGRNSKYGACYPSIELYFCYKNDFLTKKGLLHHLNKLVKFSYLFEETINGTIFYRYKEE